MSFFPGKWPCVFVLCLLALGLCAQTKRASHWYFGSGSALDFNTTPPTVTAGNPMSQLEGTASMSDEAGQLLFYTDGHTVWTRQHQPMPNGTELLGDLSSSQSALIIPKPGSTTHYYVFTAPAWGDPSGHGIRYSVVDMGLNNGLGDLVQGQKNVPLLVPATEKLAAVLHRNGRDVWVVATKYNTNEYYAYLVTEEGVCNCPVVSATGQVQSQSQGYLKFSPDGTRAASAQAVNGLELLNFDACTGVLTYAAAIPRWYDYYGNGSHLYGVCFSPDGARLYVSTGWDGFYGTSDPGENRSSCAKLYQYDLRAADLAGSRVLLYDNAGPLFPQPGCASWGVGAMQLGPDLKIYITGWLYGYLHVIHNPNEAGTKANFVKNGVYLEGTEGALGLPNFIESYFHPNPPVGACAPAILQADFRYDDACAEEPVRFVDQSVADPPALLCYEWDFGDPGSGGANFGSIANPVHVFSAAGTYQVTLRVKSGTTCRTATIRKPVTVRPALRIDLGRDTTLCRGASVRLGAAVPGAAYRWQDGSTEPFFRAAGPGTYWVEVTQANCTARDSVEVAVVELAAVDLGADLILCAGTTVSLDATRPGVTYRWQDAATGPTYTVRRPGTYWVELSNGICTVRDSIRVTYDVPRQVDLGGDTLLCLGSSLKLTFPYPDLDFRWSNQTSDPELIIEQEGTYWVSYKTPGTNCLQTDSLRVSFTECLDGLKIPNVFTPNGDAFNQTFEVVGAPGTTWHLAVYNRWGQQVARYETYRNDWQAEGLANGVYYYVLTSRVSGRSFKGWVHVRR